MERTDTERLDYFEENRQTFRACRSVTMDGNYPCWSVWTALEGTTRRKTLREAIDAAMDAGDEFLKSKEQR